MTSRSTTPGSLTVASRAATYTQINGLPGGLMCYIAVTSNSGSFTTEATLSGFDTGTITTLANRYYRVTFEVAFQSTIFADVIRCWLTGDTSTGNTHLANTDVPIVKATTGGQVFCQQTGRTFIHAPGASGSFRYKLRGERVTGSGTCIAACDTTLPGYIMVEDIGPSTGWA